MADHRVRVILEAVDRGSNNLRKFFKDGEKDVQKFRKELRDANEELEVFFTQAGGARARRGSSGPFDIDLEGTELAIVKLRQLRAEYQKAFRESNTGKAFQSFRAGANEFNAIREAFNDRINLSKEAAQKETEAFDEARRIERAKLDAQHFAARQELEKNEVEQTKIIKNEEIRRLRDEDAYWNDRIVAMRKAMAQEGFVLQENDIKRERDESNKIRRRIQALQTQRDSEIRLLRERIRSTQQIQRQEFDAETKRQRRQINAPDVGELFAKIRSDIKGTGDDLDRVESRAQRFARNIGRGFSQMRLGIALGRHELSEADKDFVRNEGRLTRLGVAFGNAFKGANQFVNVRWAIVISFLQVLGTLVVQLGLALVALASSAIEAGAALGGALLAGLTQLVPVVGLLKLAFNDLGQVLDALKLSDKIDLSKAADAKDKLDDITQATDRLADARYNLKRAAEAVGDAEFNLKQAGIDVRDALKDQTDAIENLAQARKDAARDIVDANLNEKEAALSLESATLAVAEAKRKLREEEQRNQLDTSNVEDAQAQVREAQQRLAQARSEGDTAEITVALQQLNQAEQSLSEIRNNIQNTQDDVKSAQNDVKQAELDRQQAVVRNKRAQQDAAKARQDGIAGSQQVKNAQEQLADATKRIAQTQRQQVLAQRAVRDSIHSLAVAKRDEQRAEEELTESQKKQTAQQQQLQEQLADFSPAQRRLFKAMKEFKKVFETNFGPITDIITDAFARAISKVIVIIKDPKIIRATKTLAEAIASSIDTLADFAISPEFRRFLTFTIENAARNVPKLTDTFINLFKILMRISQAATPIFNKLLDRFLAFTGKLEEKTRNKKRLDDFFGAAGRHLDAWIRFFRVAGRLLGLIIDFSAPSGTGILSDLTGALDHMADWLDNNEGKVRDFFKNVRADVSALGKTLGTVAKILFEAFTSEESNALTRFILETLVPAFASFLKILGLLARAFVFLTDIPLVGDLVKLVAQIIIIEKLFNRLIPATQKLTNLFFRFGRAIFSGAAKAAFVGLIGQMRAFIALSRQFGVLAALEAAFPKIAAGIRLVGAALKFVFITNPWIAVIAGIIAAIILLDRKFHFIAPTIKFIGKIFRDVFEWIKKHWKLLIAIILFPFGAIVFAVIKWRDKIIGFFKEIIKWVTDHWKQLILAALLAPFAIGGVIILGFLKFKDKIIGFFKNLVIDIVKEVAKLPGQLLKLFKQIPGLLKDALKGLGGIVETAIRKALPGPLERRIFGNSKTPEDEIQAANADRQRFMTALPGKAKRRAGQLKGKGKTYLEVLNILIDEGFLNENNIGLLQRLNIPSSNEFARGGSIPGAMGQAVPIIAHAGEWVLNKAQQKKVAQRLGETAEQTSMWLFGTRSDAPPGPSRPGTGKAGFPSSQSKGGTKTDTYSYADFNLVGQTDPDGIVVWFLEMADGAFGQVSAKDALRIKKSNGTWIPGYVKRSTHGYIQDIKTIHTPEFYKKMRAKTGPGRPGAGKAGFALGGIVQAFANGGVVKRWAAPGIQSFADGGTVLQSAGDFASTSITSGAKIEQNFNVTANHETDWNYVLRLGAIHAQASYS